MNQAIPAKTESEITPTTNNSNNNNSSSLDSKKEETQAELIERLKCKLELQLEQYRQQRQPPPLPTLPAGAFEDRKNPANFAGVNDSEEMFVQVLKKNLLKNKSQNNVYYSETNALLWTESLEKVFVHQKPQFVDANIMGYSATTMYMRAQYGLKWLCEKHPNDAERARWAEIRTAVSIKKVDDTHKKGVLICNKVHLVYLKRATKNMIGSAVTINSENVPAGSSKTTDVVSTLQEIAVQQQKDNLAKWRGLFFDWFTAASAGSIFEYPTENIPYREIHTLNKADETWLLDMIAEGMTVTDYKFDYENNRLSILK